MLALAVKAGSPSYPNSCSWLRKRFRAQPNFGEFTFHALG